MDEIRCAALNDGNRCVVTGWHHSMPHVDDYGSEWGPGYDTGRLTAVEKLGRIEQVLEAHSGSWFVPQTKIRKILDA